MNKEWNKSSWKGFPAKQQPHWPDQANYNSALETISDLPPLVFAGEIRTLKKLLAEAATGNAFVLQVGDCAEDFNKCNASVIREMLKVILQMSVVMACAGEKRIVKIGRIAGQDAKPRSSDTEIINGIEIPSYRGDMVNSCTPDPESRCPDPRRLVDGYFRSTASLNLIRAFTRGGYAALDQVQLWHKQTLKNLPTSHKYESLIRQINKTINFMGAIGLDTRDPRLSQVSLFTSHEALLLGYEEALTRTDSTSGDFYDCSAHMLWIGDRTRDIDGAHIEFLRGVKNPLGLKIGPNHEIDTIKAILSKLNPENEAGRITLITRFGCDKVEQYLPVLAREITKEGHNVVWSCDPMHGNTYTSSSGKKTRSFDNILAEIRNFFQVHLAEGSVPGGVHLELTGDNVTECTGGSRQLLDEDLNKNYQSNCDPRLNGEQSIELAFELAELLNPK